MATRDVIDTSLSGQTGTGSFVGSTSPTIATPVIAQINDSSGNETLKLTGVASAVNEITLSNAATGNNPIFSATGGDTDISINFQCKGSAAYQFFGTSSVPANINLFEDTDNGSNYIGLKAPAAVAANVVFELPGADGSANFIMKTNGSAVLSLTNGSQVAGTATNDSASAGNIGEFVEATVLVGSAVGLTSGINADITSISLTAGDWDVEGFGWSNPGAGTTTSGAVVWVSSTSATLPTRPNSGGMVQLGAYAANTAFGTTTGVKRFSLSGTTTVYLSVVATFAVNTLSAYGYIRARRVR